MATAADVQAEARTWVGAPLAHRGRSRTGGVDCGGLIIRVGLDTGAVTDPDNEVEELHGRYRQLPNPRVLLAVLNRYCVPISMEEKAPGDVLALSWGVQRKLPMHLAILAEREGRLMIIHAYPRIKPARVVEVGYSGEWPDRTCSAWRYPGLV